MTQTIEKKTEENANSPSIESQKPIIENADEIDYESMLEAYDSSLKDIAEGEVISGRVIQVTDSHVIVDVGFKSEGIISIHEFRDENGSVDLKPGDQVDVLLESIESDGNVILSREKAERMKIWDTIEKAYEDQSILTGRVIERIKGGLSVDIGVRAFLPGSQVDLHPVRNLDSFRGQEIQVRVIKVNKRRGNIVLSRKAVLEEEYYKQKEETLKSLKEGDRVKGIVKNITDYGAFVDLGGIDGLLHITDMSWGRINHPSEMVKVDDIIEVKVIDYDTEKQRVSLGLKQLTPHPWDEIEQRYPIGSVVKGRAVSITNYGIFVELEKGVEGLIHISELSWTQHIKHPSELFSLNDEIEAKVLSIDSEERKISLGVKQLQPDPWESIEQRYTEGMQVKGVVRNLTQFGAFVELEEGIDGLVHVSDLSWTRKIRHPKEVLQKGQEVEVVILEVNTGSRKISLGIKQLEANPWDVIEEKYKPGSMAKGEVLKILEKGVIVQLEENVEGLIPMGDMSKKDRKNYTKAVKVGEDVELRVEKVDRDERKVILSRDDLIMNEEEKEIAKVISSQENATQKIEIPEDILNKLQTEEKIAEAEEKEKPAKKKAESKKKSPKKAEKKADKESDQPEEAPAEETSEAADKVEDKVEDKKEEAVESKAADAKEIAEEDVEKEAAGKKE